ncbi:amidase [Durotheca rogersii]|uniref:amidase n=1 Tax=Durotheca rogersii TaxID=419775 RepID=UPI00221F8F91|nr:amidase [Durotheca rogersii]KAI5866035.1 amidase [Durotheca rogersii]
MAYAIRHLLGMPNRANLVAAVATMRLPPLGRTPISALRLPASGGALRLYSSARVKDMGDADINALRAQQARLMDTLHSTCAFGTGKRWGSAPTETGMSRLSLSDADKQARDWFVATARGLGCDVTVDAMGNIFAVRPGRRPGPPTFAGSHLDTQPSGGRYDGILGILAGIEMLTVLRDNKIETEFPVGVVNWTNEEGARFPISMVSSGVWAGEIPLERAHNLKEVGGGTATMKSELERIGYLGSTPASYRSTPMAAHFELHIEQGPILEAEQKKVGVVRGVQAYRWFTIDVFGREAHTGTTPLANRADAMLVAARLITHSHRVATAHAALASTGILTLSPGSTNTIPGRVTFTLDVRAPADATVDAAEADLRRDFADLAAGRDIGGLTNYFSTPRAQGAGVAPPRVEWRTDTDSKATVFDDECVGAVRSAAEAVVGGQGAGEESGLVRELSSGAGHDSVYTNRRCPTAMIFVPSRAGVSHHPEEYTSPEGCTTGASVLLQSVLRYDRLRARRE